MSETCWVVFAGRDTRGFPRQVDAERWAQVVVAFNPKRNVKVRGVKR
jgi:hypothetical protein